jgi:hypothetical protein
MLRYKTTIWRWKAEAGWHFITVDKETSTKFKKGAAKNANGWGQIKIQAKIGKTVWKTSAFPGKEGVLVIPLKADVRKKEKLKEGDEITISFEPLMY